MQLLLVQIFGSIGSFTLLVLSGTVPFCIIRCGKKRSKHGHSHIHEEHSTVMSLCNCFAGGVFISTCFLGLLPHVREHADTLRGMLVRNSSNDTIESSGVANSFLKLMEGRETDLMVLVGFCVILLVEQLVGFCHGHCSDGSQHVQSRRVYQMDTRNGEVEPFLDSEKPKKDARIFRDELIDTEDEASALSGSAERQELTVEHGHCPHHEITLDVVRAMTRSKKGKTW